MHFSRVNILMLVLMSILIVPIMSHSVLGWWNESWDYRKVITVNNVKLNFTNGYNFRLNVTWEDGMQQDFGDLRFTWLNTSATPRTEEEVDYCIGGIGCDVWYDADKKYKLNYVNGKYADVIIKVPKLSENHNETIFMYFGNDNVADNSGVAYGNFYKDFDFASSGIVCGWCCESPYTFNHSDKYVSTIAYDWGKALDTHDYDTSDCCGGCCDTWDITAVMKDTKGNLLVGYDVTLDATYCDHREIRLSHILSQPATDIFYIWYQKGQKKLHVYYDASLKGSYYYPISNGWYSIIGTMNQTKIRAVLINDTNYKFIDFSVNGNFNTRIYRYVSFESTVAPVGFDNIVVRNYQSPEPTLSISPTQSRIYTSPFRLNWLSSLKYYFDNVVAYFLVTIIIIIVSYLTVYATKSTIVGILVGLLLDMALTVVELYPLWAGIILGLIFGAILLWGEKRE